MNGLIALGLLAGVSSGMGPSKYDQWNPYFPEYKILVGSTVVGIIPRNTPMVAQRVGATNDEDLNLYSEIYFHVPKDMDTVSAFLSHTAGVRQESKFEDGASYFDARGFRIIVMNRDLAARSGTSGFKNMKDGDTIFVLIKWVGDQPPAAGAKKQEATTDEQDSKKSQYDWGIAHRWGASWAPNDRSPDIQPVLNVFEKKENSIVFTTTIHYRCLEPTLSANPRITLLEDMDRWGIKTIARHPAIKITPAIIPLKEKGSFDLRFVFPFVPSKEIELHFVSYVVTFGTSPNAAGFKQVVEINLSGQPFKVGQTVEILNGGLVLRPPR